jgi:hypothetical protein
MVTIHDQRVVISQPDIAVSVTNELESKISNISLTTRRSYRLPVSFRLCIIHMPYNTAQYEQTCNKLGKYVLTITYDDNEVHVPYLFLELGVHQFQRQRIDGNS